MISLADSKLGQRARKEAKLTFCKTSPGIYRLVDKAHFVHGAFMLAPTEQIPVLPTKPLMIEDSNGRRYTNNQ